MNVFWKREKLKIFSRLSSLIFRMRRINCTTSLKTKSVITFKLLDATFKANLNVALQSSTVRLISMSLTPSMRGERRRRVWTKRIIDPAKGHWRLCGDRVANVLARVWIHPKYSSFWPPPNFAMINPYFLPLFFERSEFKIFQMNWGH